MRNNNTGPINNRSKSCPLSGKDAPRIDYKNIRLLIESFLKILETIKKE